MYTRTAHIVHVKRADATEEDEPVASIESEADREPKKGRKSAT